MQYDLLIQSISGYKDTKYIDLQKRLENSTHHLTHYPPFWRLFTTKLKNIKFDWKVLKYSSNQLPAVSKSTSGIYLFVLRPTPTVFEPYNIIMYVGMTSQGLIERIETGYRTPSSLKGRPNIHRLILDYGNFLYWYYLPLPKTSKKKLEEIESYLIGFFNNPPINKKDEPHQIKQAKKSKMN